MVPFAAAPLQAEVPQERSQTLQITALNGKSMARSPGRRRTQASSMAVDGSSHGQNVPKSEPFNQSRINRFLREPSLLEKAEHAVAGMQ